jgi:hypothetical protein
MNKKVILMTIALVIGVTGLSVLAPAMAATAYTKTAQCACATQCKCSHCKNTCDCHGAKSCPRKSTK